MVQSYYSGYSECWGKRNMSLNRVWKIEKLSQNKKKKKERSGTKGGAIAEWRSLCLVCPSSCILYSQIQD